MTKDKSRAQVFQLLDTSLHCFTDDCAFLGNTELLLLNLEDAVIVVGISKNLERP